MANYMIFSPTTDGPATAETLNPAGGEDHKSNIEQVESKTTEPTVVRPSMEPVGQSNAVSDARPTKSSRANNEYKVGQFDAPEQLQIAVYQGLNEAQTNYSTYLDDMRCESGDCEIVIRLETFSGRSSVAADVMARINKHLEENILTADIIIGLRRLEMVEKGVARIELVTMPRPQKDAKAARR